MNEQNEIKELKTIVQNQMEITKEILHRLDEQDKANSMAEQKIDDYVKSNNINLKSIQTAPVSIKQYMTGLITLDNYVGLTKNAISSQKKLISALIFTTIASSLFSAYLFMANENEKKNVKFIPVPIDRLTGEQFPLMKVEANKLSSYETIIIIQQLTNFITQLRETTPDKEQTIQNKYRLLIWIDAEDINNETIINEPVFKAYVDKTGSDFQNNQYTSVGNVSVVQDISANNKWKIMWTETIYDNTLIDGKHRVKLIKNYSAVATIAMNTEKNKELIDKFKQNHEMYLNNLNSYRKNTNIMGVVVKDFVMNDGDIITKK